MDKQKIKQIEKGKVKRKLIKKDLKKGLPLESSLSKEDLDDHDDNYDEDKISIEDENDDQSPKDAPIILDISNIELPKYPAKVKTVLLLLKSERFMVIQYGFKGYDNDKKTSYYKRNVFENFSKAALAIENYANGFFAFENICKENFYERFKSEMLLSVKDDYTDKKNKTNRHFLTNYIKFWDGVDVKLSALTFKGKPNNSILAMTIFRIGIGSESEYLLKTQFTELVPNSLKGGHLTKTNEITRLLDDILKSSGDKTFDKDTFFEYLTENEEFKNILKNLGGQK